ncbi:hypothetical protein FJU11_02255 [Pararhizobium mangrovi]|uniref:Uncharacterized protein n=1 Tax=Pararhizobium mangrovi TaxID=2590452 RepID=A0A506UGC7_9HYPH|nr:hypothetical protein FJU11_02255 [Pararhizobium mangrovi]
METERFGCEAGLRIVVQVPEAHERDIRDAVVAEAALSWGDYDRVSFTTRSGTQRFRSLGTGHNAATPDTVEVECVELSFFLASDAPLAKGVLHAIYAAHPYEEPVVFVTPCLRTRHVRGTDEDNPNRFWNRSDVDWAP